MLQTGFTGLNDQQRAELWAVLALYELKGLKIAACAKLVEHFGSPYRAVSNVQSWAGMGVSEDIVNRYQRGIWRDEAKTNWNRIRESAVNILLYNDDKYPALLREIPDPPLILFYLGDISLLNSTSIGVVGARDCTKEGMSVAVDIVRGLTHAGITTISGLAKGIDRVVHLAGLEGPGSSIAVLGSGVDVPYPKGNLDLYDLMKEKGLIISEFMPGAEPKQYNFPIRNRVISGLSRAVLVVEAAVRSGTLITARHAAEQGRDVFAVPGSTTSETSEGCRDLIRRGAKAMFSAEDILLELAPILKAELEEKVCSKGVAPAKPAKALEDLGILPWENRKTAKSGSAAKPRSAPPKNSPPVEVDGPLPEEKLERLLDGQSPLEREILKVLNRRQNCHIDIVCNALMLDVSQVSSALTMLEVKGLVTRLPGMYYNISQ